MKKKVFIIADYFIYKNSLSKKGLTNKKLQKLLYYAQAWNLVINKKILFKDDIQAWIHGPAIPIVYEKFKIFGYEEITKKVSLDEFDSLNKNERNLLDTIWDIYGKYDGNYLETLSHSEDPWIKARNSVPDFESSTNIISPKDMTTYYGRLQKQA